MYRKRLTHIHTRTDKPHTHTHTLLLHLSTLLLDADDFDPEAGFTKEGGDDAWAGEDEGLDTEVGTYILI